MGPKPLFDVKSDAAKDDPPMNLKANVRWSLSKNQNYHTLLSNWLYLGGANDKRVAFTLGTLKLVVQ